MKKKLIKLVLKELYPNLVKEEAGLNKKGKPTGQFELMLTKEGLATGNTGKRNKVKKHVLKVLELLLKYGCHFVLQAGEGDGIKLVGPDGMTRALLLYRSSSIQSYNLQSNKEITRLLLLSAGFDHSSPEKTAYIRENSKSEYVYTDFPENAETEMIVNFLMSLPASKHWRFYEIETWAKNITVTQVKKKQAGLPFIKRK